MNRVWLQSLLLDDASLVVKRVVQAALEGDMAAARIVMDRVMPKNRHAIAGVSIPKLQSASDACEALSAIAFAVMDGRISTTEALELSTLVENFRKALDTTLLEQRIALLEQRLGESG